jgi:hypothetical protein
MRVHRFSPIALSCFLVACAADGIQTDGQTVGSLPSQPAAPVNVGSAEITQAFVGRTAIFPDGAEASYTRDGAYRYFNRGQASAGRYTIIDGQICVTFTPRAGSAASNARCDEITKQGDAYSLTNAAGHTYPVRFR